MNLFMLGDFTLNSGARSAWKLECDALTDADVACLAHMIRETVGPYSGVSGVPRGGLRLAAALRPFAGPGGPHLLVDDVMTTGGSMGRARLEIRTGDGPESERVVGAVIFARGRCPGWVTPLFQTPEALWVKGALK